MSATIRESVGAKHARILSVGAYRPSRVVTNEEVCQYIDSSDEWIRERSGIIERRYAGENESVGDMAVNAASIAIQRAGIDPAEIGMVLTATVTYSNQMPAVSVEIADRIGAANAAAMDISAACAGFCYGVSLASDMVRGGSAKYVLVTGVERLTDWIDRTDRSTAFIFADAAGAVIIGPSDEPGIGPTVWGAEGDQREVINMTRTIIEHRNDPDSEFPAIVMEGPTVFRWAVTKMAKVTHEALDAAGITADQLDAFIPHQANMRITDALIRALKLPEHVPVARDIAYTGNTSAASIPLAMDRMLSEGEIPSGGNALIIGFGAGLVYAAQVIKLP